MQINEDLSLALAHIGHLSEGKTTEQQSGGKSFNNVHQVHMLEGFSDKTEKPVIWTRE